MCVKFRDFITIPCPSKTASYFMAKNVSPWQRRLIMGYELPDVASPRSYILAESISGASAKFTRSNYTKYDACYFLSPVGGAMAVTKYDPIRVFGPGPLTSV